MPIRAFSSGDDTVTLWAGVSRDDFPALTVTIRPLNGDQASSAAVPRRRAAAGLPLYLFAADTTQRKAAGEGINAFGGTWQVVKVGATSSRSTPSNSGGVGY